MTKYKINVIKQNRILLSILTMAIILPFCFILSAKLEMRFFKITIPILILGSLTTLIYYFSFGQLKIILIDRELNFKWNKKPIFNFKEYNSIRIDEITAIIVEQGTYLRKLKTKESVIELGGMKTNKPDSTKLLKLLKSETSVKPMDSWDVWKELGWLTLAYRINLVVLIVVIVIIVTYITIKGFDSQLLLFMPLCLSQLILSHLQMKSKLK